MISVYVIIELVVFKLFMSRKLKCIFVYNSCIERGAGWD